MPTQKIKERPVLFSTPMVQAILAGRKTMTRRVVKHQDCVEFDKEGAIYVHHPKCPSYCEYGCNGAGFGTSRYGIPGDHLWVRETWAKGWYGDKKDGELVVYRADEEQCGTKWKSPYHMFRKDSRITLEITDVGVEKVTDITEGDCNKEGVYIDGTSSMGHIFTAVEHFAALWDFINGKKYPWSSNPWCWVIEFKKA